jgi:hypothetical protein
MDSKRKVSQMHKNNPQGSQLRRPKNGRWNCVQTDINKCIIKNCKERPKTELTGRSPLRRRCSPHWTAAPSKKKITNSTLSSFSPKIGSGSNRDVWFSYSSCVYQVSYPKTGHPLERSSTGI